MRKMKPLTLLSLLLIVVVLGAAAYLLMRPGTPVSDDTGLQWPERPNVLLIGLDTARADHVCNTAQSGVRTPYMGALARDGIRFERCISTAPWTLPSFASIFTGRLPYQHGAIGGDFQMLDEEHTTIAEYFDAAGYNTVGFMGVPYLTGTYGMTQGYNADIDLPRFQKQVDRAASITSLSLAYLKRFTDKPFYLFSHYYDPHAPYAPPPPYDSIYYFDRDPRGPGEPIVEAIMASHTLLDDNKQTGMYDWLEGVTDWQYPPTQYAAEISYTDEEVGRLLEGLKDLGLYDDMLIVLTADHGEHLMDHDIYFTHYLPYQETIHVPLIVKLPGNRGAGRVIADPVSTLDILPTILEVAGLEATVDLEGHNLAKALLGRAEIGLRTLLAEQGSAHDRFTKVVIEYPWKLMYFREPDSERYALYRIDRDPYERQDLVAAEPGIVAELTDRLWSKFARETPVTADGRALPADLPPEERRRLRALGYVD